MSIEKYIETVSTRFKSGISREHSYRGDLETLIRELVQGVEITNEPANVTDCGNPDIGQWQHGHGMLMTNEKLKTANVETLHARSKQTRCPVQQL